MRQGDVHCGISSYNNIGFISLFKRLKWAGAVEPYPSQQCNNLLCLSCYLVEDSSCKTWRIGSLKSITHQFATFLFRIMKRFRWRALVIRGVSAGTIAAAAHFWLCALLIYWLVKWLKWKNRCCLSCFYDLLERATRRLSTATACLRCGVPCEYREISCPQPTCRTNHLSSCMQRGIISWIVAIEQPANNQLTQYIISSPIEN